MGTNSRIEWTHHTFNPWWGCTRVSPACDNCYADTWARRLGLNDLWDGPKRRTFGAKHWAEPLKWNRAAEAAGRRSRVFCASMADVFDKDAPGHERDNLWDVIQETPNLDWLLLTKRIGNVRRMLPEPPSNVWLGISVINQEEADRDVPKLLEIPARIRFLSCEPMLGSIDLTRIVLKPSDAPERGKPPVTFDSLAGWYGGANHGGRTRIDWVIAGGESGAKARPLNALWADSLRGQCAQAGVAFFFKQGSQANWPAYKDFDSFPPELRVREWPEVSSP